MGYAWKMLGSCKKKLAALAPVRERGTLVKTPLQLYQGRRIKGFEEKRALPLALRMGRLERKSIF